MIILEIKINRKNYMNNFLINLRDNVILIEIEKKILNIFVNVLKKYIMVLFFKNVNYMKIFKNVNNKSHAYFIHSYEFVPKDLEVISLTTNYGRDIVAGVCYKNICGSQFHPEKSQETGIKILTNFLKI